MAQWLGIRLPVWGTWVRALVQEDPTCCRAARPKHHNYWACTLEPAHLQPVLCGGRGHRGERPVHGNEEWPPPTATKKRKPTRSHEVPTQPKINKLIKKKIPPQKRWLYWILLKQRKRRHHKQSKKKSHILAEETSDTYIHIYI